MGKKAKLFLRTDEQRHGAMPEDCSDLQHLMRSVTCRFKSFPSEQVVVHRSGFP